jgi:hypothetical protein
LVINFTILYLIFIFCFI